MQSSGVLGVFRPESPLYCFAVTRPIRLHSLPSKLASFIEPMECEPVATLQDGTQWVYEIKLDGYRAIAVKSDGNVWLFSRSQKSFNQQYPYIDEALSDLPDGTVIDGEIVALDDSARPQFNLLQNYRSEARRIRYFVFDLLCYKNRDTTSLPLVERRELLRTLKSQSPRIQVLDYFETSAANMVAEWTAGDRLRHSKFVGLRDDKDPRKIVKEA